MALNYEIYSFMNKYLLALLLCGYSNTSNAQKVIHEQLQTPYTYASKKMKL